MHARNNTLWLFLGPYQSSERVLVFLKLRTSVDALSLTERLIPQIPHTYTVVVQRAGIDVCDDTPECPLGGGRRA